MRQNAAESARVKLALVWSAPQQIRVDPLCQDFRAFCRMRDRVAYLEARQYEHRSELRSAWAELLARGEGDGELRRLGDRLSRA
jgi:hypothetical protein